MLNKGTSKMKIKMKSIIHLKVENGDEFSVIVNRQQTLIVYRLDGVKKTTYCH